tara:strand:+ start:674 stop:877 length:204 start_codon:yes stop_codon:yes gene_type:complete
MTIKQYRALNTAPPEYQQHDEGISRRTIEQNFEDVSTDMNAQKQYIDKDASLALRKYQFLLLGASNG